MSTSPDATLQRALASLEQAISINPRNAEAHAALAELRHLEAGWLRQRRRSAATPIRAGLEAAERALAINPRRAWAIALRGALLLLRAQEVGEDRETFLREGREEIERAVAINPNRERRFRRWAG